MIFDDYDEADKAREIIREVMQRVRHKPEFKFSSCNATNKDEFFQAIRVCKFRIRYICVAKKAIYDDKLSSNPANFYNHTLKKIIQASALCNAKIRIDGDGNKKFNNALKKYITVGIQPGTVKSLKFIDSKKEELIQLADMVTGAIARPYNSRERSDFAKWKDLIKHKIDKDGELIVR